jgi:hypothetical protein
MGIWVLWSEKKAMRIYKNPLKYTIMTAVLNSVNDFDLSRYGVLQSTAD